MHFSQKLFRNQLIELICLFKNTTTEWWCFITKVRLQKLFFRVYTERHRKILFINDLSAQLVIFQKPLQHLNWKILLTHPLLTCWMSVDTRIYLKSTRESPKSTSLWIICKFSHSKKFLQNIFTHLKGALSHFSSNNFTPEECIETSVSYKNLFYSTWSGYTILPWFFMMLHPLPQVTE